LLGKDFRHVAGAIQLRAAIPPNRAVARSVGSSGRGRGVE
jgi:hypothetical protein